MTQPTQSPSWLHLLSDQALADMSGPTVFERGLNYAASGLAETAGDVTLRPGEQAAIEATVHGNLPYAVRLWISADDELDGACTCPHAQDGNFCKHLVALALAWRAALGDAAAISLPQTARKQSSATQKSSVQTERQDALRRFIWEQDASVLAERLWSWAERDRACMADLKIWASSSKAVDDPKALRAAIDAVLPRRNGYLDWRRSNDYARQGSAVMELLRPWVQRDAATARELCEHALRRLFKVAEQSDDSLGGIGGLIQDLMGLLIETLRTAAPPASWIDRWFKLMDADPWGLWNEPAVLEAAGPEAQARYAERACQDWHKWRQRPRKTTSRRSSSFLTSDDDLERDLLRRRYLEVLARQDDPRALLDAMIESVETAAEYCDVVAFCEARNWHREALQWAQSAARLHPRDARCEDALLRCYERDGWDEEALAIRRQRLEHHPGPMQYMALLRAAKNAKRDPALYRAELFAWAEQREQAKHKHALEQHRHIKFSDPLATPRLDVSVRVQWLVAEKKLDDAWSLTQTPDTQCDAAVLEQLADAMPKQRRADAARLLQRIFEHEMKMASFPYDGPLKRVRQIVACLPPTQASAWVESLRSTYKARRRFIAGLP